MKTVSNIVSLCFIMVFSSRCEFKRRDVKVYYSDTCQVQPKHVEFYNLVDSFSYYHNRFVEVSGYFDDGFEKVVLVDSRKRKGPAIWIEFYPSLYRMENNDTIYFNSSLDEYRSLQNRNLVLRGVVDTSKHGHLSQYSATLKNVCFVRILE